jgi:hypothetical protein
MNVIEKGPACVALGEARMDEDQKPKARKTGMAAALLASASKRLSASEVEPKGFGHA